MTLATSLLASIYGFYLLAVMSPGPNTFIVMRLALTRSRRDALSAVLGIALGNSVWLCLVLGGLSLLLKRMPGGMALLRLLGGSYLIYLGVRALLGERKATSEMAENNPTRLTAERPLRSGLLASLTNPNTLPFYLSILAPALALEVPGWVRVTAGGGILAIAIGWYGTVAWLASHPRAQRAYVGQERLIHASMAVVMVGYGIRILAELRR